MTAEKNEMALFAERVDRLLDTLLPQTTDGTRRVWEAMRYSTLSGGKRIRPYLVQETAKILGGDSEVSLWFAAAVELIHTYSLIHDDLPCMDNDDYRRGKLTCHKMFDEATALLAGDGLLTLAFHTLAASHATDRQKAAAVCLLSETAGCHGMIGGQVMDLEAENIEITFDTLRKLYKGKTSALMRASVGLGCIASDIYDGEVFDAFATYAEEVGMTFQMVDDLLDVYGTEALGKPIGSDARNGKNTYLSFLKPEEVKAEAKERTAAAKAAIADIPGTKALCDLADSLLTRQR